MEYRKITSANDWRDLWLGKFVSELKTKTLPSEENDSYRAVLLEYLMAFEGNPREIDLKKMKQFVSKRKNRAIPPLLLFYQSVARSDKHLEVLNQLAVTKEKPASKKL